MQTGYSVTDVMDGDIKIVHLTNQVSLHVTTVLPKALQIIVTSLVRILTRPIGQECAFQIFFKTLLLSQNVFTKMSVGVVIR